jgi:hypothetical protein
MAVVLGWAKGWKDLKGKGRHDGLWKQIYEAREGLEVEVLKTKAHRSKEQATREGDLTNFEGNEAADREAKRAANKHGHPPSTCTDAEDRQAAKRNGVAWSLATLKQAAIELPDVPRRASRAERLKRRTADWEGVGCVLVASLGGGLVCRMCFRQVGQRTKQVARCQGLNTATRQIAANAQGKGHELWVGRRVGGTLDGAPLFMCRGCGLFASVKCKGLKDQCPREWGGRSNGHKRFMDGRHPGLANVLIEGQRVTTPMDFETGVKALARRGAYWAHASEGGLKRGAPIGGGLAGKGLALSGEAGGPPLKAGRVALPCCPGVEAGASDPFPEPEGHGDDWMGGLGRPPEVLVDAADEWGASEVDSFFGL